MACRGVVTKIFSRSKIRGMRRKWSWLYAYRGERVRITCGLRRVFRTLYNPWLSREIGLALCVLRRAGADHGRIAARFPHPPPTAAGKGVALEIGYQCYLVPVRKWLFSPISLLDEKNYGHLFSFGKKLSSVLDRH